MAVYDEERGNGENLEDLREAKAHRCENGSGKSATEGGKYMRNCISLRWITAFLIFGLPLGLGLQSEADEKSGYAGSETCKGCHENIYSQYAKSVHGKKAI